MILIVWQAVETLLENLELDKRSYRLGLSQVGCIQKVLLCWLCSTVASLSYFMCSKSWVCAHEDKIEQQRTTGKSRFYLSGRGIEFRHFFLEFSSHVRTFYRMMKETNEKYMYFLLIHLRMSPATG